MGRYDHWEMREGGPYDAPEAQNEIFKCPHCGGETFDPDRGWNGEPDPANCRPDCPCRSDWSPGRATREYKRHFDRIFPDAPGAGW